jgi:hypothetical protein
VYAVEQEAKPPRSFAPKPKGLWVSDEDEYGWREWCTDESFSMERLEHAHRVELADDARLLVIRDADGIDDFTRLYSLPGRGDSYYVDWPAVASRFQGIVITPYIWARRLSDASWYYPWDCASGCIWDPTAIASIAPVELEPLEVAS